MAEYPIESLLREVRISLDENPTSESLKDIGDTETLSLDAIISKNIELAAKIVEVNAPYYMLDGGEGFADKENPQADNSVSWASGEVGIGFGTVKLPDNFLRLVSFKMSDWDYSVSEAIPDSDPRYAMQFSRFGGIKGNPQRPVVAVVQRSSGLCLQFFSCRGGEGVSVEIAQYIPIPRIAGEKIAICERLKPAIVKYAAYLTALTIGYNELAPSLLVMAKELAEIPENNEQ